MKASFWFLVSLVTPLTAVADTISITTWNIEHLGSSGRGFGGGFGSGDLAKRTEEQLKSISVFIKDELGSDILALQEISITSDGAESRSKQLDTIKQYLGGSWEYYLPPKSDGHSEHSMYVGFLWNGDKVNPRVISPMPLKNQELAGKDLFDRTPVLAVFDAVEDNETKNDFALINVHLASGQNYDENHLIAMTLIEWEIHRFLSKLGIKESDRIILGDFNDNPYRLTSADKPKYSPALYAHMEFKGYKNYSDPRWGSTRMDDNLTSLIDHVLVNRSAQRHLSHQEATIWKPASTEDFANWRQTYSDHFPISIVLNVASDDDTD